VSEELEVGIGLGVGLAVGVRVGVRLGVGLAVDVDVGVGERKSILEEAAAGGRELLAKLAKACLAQIPAGDPGRLDSSPTTKMSVPNNSTAPRIGPLLNFPPTCFDEFCSVSVR